ncbi:TPA: hypothetical protein DD449_02800 [Candidatus Berkelbacteria bacterium]|nr:hypothetical protein [Candidatus Berkelbacteria bacterium]
MYQAAPDVNQQTANEAIDIIQQHLYAAHVRRTKDLNEEQKVSLLRDLQHYFDNKGDKKYTPPEMSLWEKVACLYDRIFHGSRRAEIT